MKCVFDKDSYNRSDALSKDSTIKVIENLIKAKHINEVTVKENPDKYGIDLLVFDNNNVVGYIECEQSYKWGDEEYPYKTIRLPERKEKYLTPSNLPYGDKQVLFVMINNKGNRAVLYLGEVAKKAPKKEVFNYRTGVEMMREINIKDCYICKI